MPKSGDTATAHLAPDVRELLVLDDEARVQSMQRDRWIDYGRASAVLDRLDHLLTTPQRDRMPCLLLHGDSNIGKTQIVRKFIRDHPSTFDEERGVELRQVICMQMPPLPDQKRFYSALLFEIGAPHSPKASVTDLEGIARTLLRGMKPRLLVVDEVHHLLAGNYREQRAAMNLLKYLANDQKMCVVLVGTADAVVALQTDAQMSSRFTPMELPRWSETEEFRRFLHAFEKLLPLKRPSSLAQRDSVQFVLAATGGLTGAVANMLTRAAVFAIRDRSESISLAHLEKVAQAAA
ncbi:TniB family NTP-binding protein [Pseudorhodoferax sp. LjRoot39]|uniref:TniB family NTP-binding protein n=1 Tax=Pseudorhodoferax sp. LjRoot39 TaxID=3342328 RepID=UPI003ED10965